MVGASFEATLDLWAQALRDVKTRLRPLFTQERVAVSAGQFLDGVLGGERRKTDGRGPRRPAMPVHGASRPSRDRWDADALRDVVRDDVVEQLIGEDAVLVIDETGFLKQGKASCGVGRQSTGSAGKITNCRTGVFASTGSRHGHAFIDRALYMPKSWTDNAGRLERAHVPAQTRFASKPQLAAAMIERALAARVSFRWVAADCAYGVGALAMPLRRAGRGYVLGVKGDSRFSARVGKPAVAGTAEAIARGLEPTAWRQLSAGAGLKGARLFDWADHGAGRSDRGGGRRHHAGALDAGSVAAVDGGQQLRKVAAALAPGGVDDEAAPSRARRASPPFSPAPAPARTRRRPAWPRRAPGRGGPAPRTRRQTAARCRRPRLAQLDAQPRSIHGIGILMPRQGVAGPAPAERHLCRKTTDRCAGDSRTPARFSMPADKRAQARQRPVRPVRDRLGQDLLGHRQRRLIPDRGRPRSKTGPQRLDPAPHEGTSPQPHRVLAHPERLGTAGAGPARRRGQHRPCPVRRGALARDWLGSTRAARCSSSTTTGDLPAMPPLMIKRRSGSTAPMRWPDNPHLLGDVKPKFADRSG